MTVEEIHLENMYPFLSWMHACSLVDNEKCALYNYWLENEASIQTQIICDKFDTIMYLYGYPVLLGMLDYFQRKEMYEKCAAIVAQIKRHNELVNDNIPTKMGGDA